MPKDRKKLYIIGIDAAPLWLIKDNYRKYNLDGFSELMAKGALTDLESTMPPMTGPSWPSIYTGFRPGDHGVPEFLKIEANYTRSVVYYNPEIKPPFWDSLAQKGLRSLVMNPAMLVKTSKYPNVDMMTGFPLPPKFSSKEVKEVADSHDFIGEPEIEMKLHHDEMSLDEASERYIESIRKRAEVSRELIDMNDYDLSFICFTETDRVQHFALNKPEWKRYTLPLYEQISVFLKWIERRAEKENGTVIVVSDHGAQPIKKALLMNGWLINKGYSKMKRKIEEGLKSGESTGALRYKLREQVLRSVHRKGSKTLLYSKLPSGGKRIVRAVLANVFTGTSTGNYTRIHDFDYDMEHTLAFASIANCPTTTIFINDHRFQHGCVSAADKKRIKRKIMRDLMSIKDDKGKKLITGVYDADDYYEGTKLFIAPDIFASVRKGYILEAFGYQKNGNLFMKPERPKSGDHLQNGIFGVVSYGEKLDYRKIAETKLYVYNINPTVMRYFGYAPQNDKRYKPIF
ncbi:alkaline phosphatase family protein [Candidatus Marsarchaeota archaeon]|jgi:predicted AlkP superfamily phosphohydrolase/phosphomutase|nr:alkaline phosphatase family protein [Candidatus Marsarchaeota archaeon]